jgi:hypothetical protein
MQSRTFLNVSLGILALAAAYHLGARSAIAQAGGQLVGFTVTDLSSEARTGNVYVITASGEVFSRGMNSVAGPGPLNSLGNFWGGPTPARQESFGAVKARYR